MNEVLSKYEILKSYKDSNHSEYIRDTWLALGGASIVATTRTYIKDMVYRVDLATSSGDILPNAIFHGALIICEASLYNSDPLSWSTADIEDEEQGFITFINGVISPHFRLLLTADELDAITIAPNPAFVPYSETNTSSIIIPDDELEKILFEVGVPFVLLEELEFSRNKICDNAIKPAMQEYFKYFPIIRRELKYNSISQAGQTFKIPLPINAYGAVRAYINQGTTNESGAAAGNPLHFFASEIAWWGGGSNSSSWSPRMGAGRSPGFANLQGFNTMALDRAARQGILNYATRCEVHIEREGDQKYLVGYANRVGTLEIHWALASNDWSDIEYSRQSELRQLCTARVLRGLGMLRGQVKSDSPGSINFDMFINRAKELEDKVLEFWNNIPKVAIVRGSM